MPKPRPLLVMVSDTGSIVSQVLTILIGLEDLLALLQFLVAGLKCLLQLPYLQQQEQMGSTQPEEGNEENLHSNREYTYYTYVGTNT